MTTLYTGGTFDMLHSGHLNFLKKCKEVADVVVVSLNTDEFCEEYKRIPIMTYAERKESLLSCRFVDAVVKNTGGFDSEWAISVVNPDIIAHGDDWIGDEYLIQLGIDAKYLEDNNIKLMHFPYSKGISSTDIISRCKGL